MGHPQERHPWAVGRRCPGFPPDHPDTRTWLLVASSRTQQEVEQLPEARVEEVGAVAGVEAVVEAEAPAAAQSHQPR